METLLQKFSSEILLEYEKNNNIIQDIILDKNNIIEGLQETITNHENSIEQLTATVIDLTQECKIMKMFQFIKTYQNKLVKKIMK